MNCSSFLLFTYALDEEHAEKFERLESLLIKMKQYESFFRASPEAFVQITFRIVHFSLERKFGFEGEQLVILNWLRLIGVTQSFIEHFRSLDNCLYRSLRIFTLRIKFLRSCTPVL